MIKVISYILSGNAYHGVYLPNAICWAGGRSRYYALCLHADSYLFVRIMKQRQPEGGGGREEEEERVGRRKGEGGRERKGKETQRKEGRNICTCVGA